jgi:RNA recognition motif-containing protein
MALQRRQFPKRHLVSRGRKRNRTPLKSAMESQDESSSEKEQSSVIHSLERTIFVGNVPIELHRRKLEALFRPFGKIISSRFRSIAPAKPNIPPGAALAGRLWHPARRTCNAFLVFQEPVAVERALTLNGTALDLDDGTQVHLRVDRCRLAPRKVRERLLENGTDICELKRSSLVGATDEANTRLAEAHWDHQHSIFLGNVPFDANEEEIRRLFADCGPVTNVRLVRDAQTSMGKGFAYVTFAPEANMDLALGRHEAVLLRGRYLRVQRSSARLAERRQQARGKQALGAASPPRRPERNALLPEKHGPSRKDDSIINHSGNRAHSHLKRKQHRNSTQRLDPHEKDHRSLVPPVASGNEMGIPYPSFAGQVADPSKSPFARPHRRRRRRLPKQPGQGNRKDSVGTHAGKSKSRMPSSSRISKVSRD